jgi:hypothetical protein
MYSTYYLHLVGMKEVVESFKITSELHIAVMFAAVGV